jgi:hypothetical protein
MIDSTGPKAIMVLGAIIEMTAAPIAKRGFPDGSTSLNWSNRPEISTSTLRKKGIFISEEITGMFTSPKTDVTFRSYVRWVKLEPE